ncbi:alanine/glycine:cation symporter family protein [Arenimonas sp. MALMAid1274]|uniref:alanine/glycine:cation symporter family protein n=1 Tax=Arenimonas sp. MALMAid1274 TaxID=3411630 RepID=UPI003BA354AA
MTRLLSNIPAAAADASAPAAAGIDQAIQSVFGPVADALARIVFVEIPLPGGLSASAIVIWLAIAACVFTVYFRFINLRGFVHGFRILRGDYADPTGPGEVSHFQALTSAVSGTVGLGNIAGVAVAITVGGPGATFWMIVAGLLGMSSKFVECTLGVMYRRQNADGSISGGPMYYLSQGLAVNRPRLAGLGRGLAIFYAACIVGGAAGSGALFQANQTYAQVLSVTGGAEGPLAGRGWLFGLGLAVLTGIVVVGGISRIGRVTAKLVPAMALLYVTAGAAVLAVHVDQIPAAVGAILHGAFTGEAAYGGVLGALIVGFRRAAFSNEAGLGSSAIAHSAVRTREPLTEGFVALWEPFIDTVVICTMTALIIIVSGQYLQPGPDGVALTSRAFASVFSWFPYVLTVAVFLFAYSTMITWGYYGTKAVGFLTGESKLAMNVFKLVFLAMTVVGCSMQLGSIVGIADAMLLLMSVPNLIGVYLLMPVVRRELDSYLARLKSGEIRPTADLETPR